MNDEVFALATQLVSPSYVAQAQQARRARETKFKSLLAQRRLPDNGWDEGTLRLLLEELALMDSNAFIGNAGVGEREARIACPLVRSRHFGFGHGIGRSGDIAEEQPKAAGSSLLYKLTNFLAADAIKRAGALSVNVNCLVLPVATGMTVTLTMLALRAMRPAAKYVVWPRIDQKSCLKAVAAAGCTPLVVESLLEGDELRTNVPGVRARIEEVGAEHVLCVLSTTSCFAPRGIDKLLDLGRLCAEMGVPHIANNAYGVQCTQCMKAIAAASKHGRLDAFIQSTDKNFLVPVGGAILASCSAEFGAALIAKVSATYPGRASIAPILDLFITLLHLGADGWASLLERRQRLLPTFRERLGALAASHGERLLVTPNNSISMAVTLTSGGGGRSVTAMGAQLWVRLISGARICAPDAKKKSVAGIAFTNYGSHCDAYPVAYFTAACALGATEEDLDLFLKRLDKTLKEWKKMKPHAAESPAKCIANVQSGARPAEGAEAAAGAEGAAEAAGAAGAVGGAGAARAAAPAPAPQGAEGEVAAASAAALGAMSFALEPSGATSGDSAGVVATPAAEAPPTTPTPPPMTPTPPLPPPAEPTTSDPMRGFTVRSERVAYRRFLQVEERVVGYPDGREASFDIVGHPKNQYCFVVVFAYHSASASVTVLREFAQAAPPHAATTLVLPTGGYDPTKHSSLLGAAQAELAEEARLAGGTWHALLPEAHPGILESKWCRNRFTPFVCIDPEPDSGQGERDVEEYFESCERMPLAELRAALAQGEFLPPSMQTCFSAMEWLARQSAS